MHPHMTREKVVELIRKAHEPSRPDDFLIPARPMPCKSTDLSIRVLVGVIGGLILYWGLPSLGPQFDWGQNNSLRSQAKAVCHSTDPTRVPRVARQP